MQMRYLGLILLLYSTCQLGFGQSKIEPQRSLLIQLGYGYQSPLADLSTRFGNNSYLVAQMQYLTKKNYTFGMKYNFMFGDRVKQDVLQGLRTVEGFIVSTDRSPADIQLRQRGFYASGFVGKLFTLSDAQPQSGLLVNLGAGLLQHKIRIQDDPQRVVPQLSSEYKKGYDRLTNGLTMHQFIGYQYLSQNQRINFSIGVEAIEGFTQNRRDWNFDTRSRESDDRLDVLLGIQANWIIPIYFNRQAEEIIY